MRKRVCTETVREVKKKSSYSTHGTLQLISMRARARRGKFRLNTCIRTHNQHSSYSCSYSYRFEPSTSREDTCMGLTLLIRRTKEKMRTARDKVDNDNGRGIIYVPQFDKSGKGDNKNSTESGIPSSNKARKYNTDFCSKEGNPVERSDKEGKTMMKTELESQTPTKIDEYSGTRSERTKKFKSIVKIGTNSNAEIHIKSDSEGGDVPKTDTRTKFKIRVGVNGDPNSKINPEGGTKSDCKAMANSEEKLTRKLESKSMIEIKVEPKTSPKTEAMLDSMSQLNSGTKIEGSVD